MPTEIHLTGKRGDSNQYRATILNEDTGLPQNITGATIWCTLKRSKDELDATAVAQASTINGQITITDGVGGVCLIEFTPANTSGLTYEETLYHDVQVLLAGKVRTAIEGTITFSMDVTRAIA